MTNKITQSLIAGIVGTAVMTLVMMLAAMMGMPKMSPPAMLSAMMGVPIIAGWLMHFMIGIIFAMIYAFLFIKAVRKVGSNILKGAIFGIAAFLFAQIAMAILGSMFPAPAMEGSMALIMIGSIMGHIIFGIVVALFVKEQAV
jgi:hypothetical protein